MEYFIIGCELAFWVFVLAGMMFRYILKQKKLGAALLICTPLIDLVLIIAALYDLKQGATASVIHSISAVYIGVSVAFGHKMVSWADERFAFRFANGPAPVPKPKYGVEHARHECTGFLLHLLAYAIGFVVLKGMIYMVGDASLTENLSGTINIWGIIVGIDALISLSYTLWPKKAKTTSNK